MEYLIALKSNSFRHDIDSTFRVGLIILIINRNILFWVDLLFEGGLRSKGNGLFGFVVGKKFIVFHVYYVKLNYSVIGKVRISKIGEPKEKIENYLFTVFYHQN